MRIVSAAIIFCTITCLLSGCSTALQVENQAYVLTMGLDKQEQGLKLTVQVPKIVSSGEQENASPGSGSCFRFSSEGESCEEAIEKLGWVIPR